MKKICLYLFVLIFSTLSTVSKAQNISPVDFMRNNPRAAYANPSFFTPEYGFFDFALGGINIGVQNTGFRYKDLFDFNEAGQPVTLNLNKAVDGLRNTNNLNTFMDFDVFNCGRLTRHGFFTYSHRIRVMESFRFSKDLIELLAQGNGAFMGADHPVNVDLGLSMKAYQEFNFGYQMCLTDKLNIGARFKFLIGAADAKSRNLKMQLVTNPETYALSLSGDVDVLTSLPYDVSMNQGHLSVADTRFNIANMFRNFGGGIDLGAEYRINDQFGVDAAINDLGFIRWNHSNARFVAGIEDGGSFYQDGSFVFSGLTQDQLNGLMNESGYASNLMDSLFNYFNIHTVPMTGYTTGLNTKMMVRGYYDLTPSHRFSAQLMGYASGVGFRPALTLAYAGSYLDMFDVVTTYTMMKGSYGNVGLGLSANFGGFLIYVASNNVIGLFDPLNSRNLNLQFGISFTGGDKINRSDRIVIKEASEEED